MTTALPTHTTPRDVIRSGVWIRGRPQELRAGCLGGGMLHPLALQRLRDATGLWRSGLQQFYQRYVHLFDDRIGAFRRARTGGRLLGLSVAPSRIGKRQGGSSRGQKQIGGNDVK